MLSFPAAAVGRQGQGKNRGGGRRGRKREQKEKKKKKGRRVTGGGGEGEKWAGRRELCYIAGARLRHRVSCAGGRRAQARLSSVAFVLKNPGLREPAALNQGARHAWRNIVVVQVEVYFFLCVGPKCPWTQ